MAVNLRSMCLSCQLKRIAIPNTPRLFSQCPSFRSASSSSKLRRRKPARMALSENVNKPAITYGEQKKKPAPHPNQGAFGAMNQTRARLRDSPRTRSVAANKRSSEKSTDESKESTHVYKALKMQVALSPVPYARRMAIKEKIADITSFDQFPLLDAVRKSVYEHALAGLQDITPTAIQRVAIPALLKPTSEKPQPKTGEADTPHFDQFLLAAETGSGKTLAYLLPIIDALKRNEVVQKEEDAKLAFQKEQLEQEEKEERERKNVFELQSPELTTPETHGDVAKPRVIILVPTSELVTQVGQLVKRLSHTAKYRSALISSSQTPRRIRNSLFHPGGLDVLVTTPHLLSSIAEANPYILSRVSHLVVDEADSLFDRSFSPITSTIIEKSASSLKQLVLCSATIPRSLDNSLRTQFPEIKRLVTPNLHAIPRRVQLGVVEADKDPYRGNKNLACADVIWSLGKAGNAYESDMVASVTGTPEIKHIIVFVNERGSAEEVAEYLHSKGIDSMALTRDTSEKRQNEILTDFTYVRPSLSRDDVKLLQRSQQFNPGTVPFETPKDSEDSHDSIKRLANTRVLVVTDLGSRGIDTVAVKTVILYDVPHSTVDFIHRLGRVGRMGRRGRGIVLVGKKDRKDVVKEVREAMYRGQALI